MPQLFFTKAGALRILQAQGIAAKQVETLRVYKNSIQVTYLTQNGRCSTFLSKKAFVGDFTTFRQESASHCTVKRWSAGTYACRYEVKSSDGNSFRTVDLSGGMPLCSCPDYETQRHYLGRAIPGCKHIMAVIGQLGHASLTQYLETITQKARADLFGGGWDEQTQHLIEPPSSFIDQREDVNQLMTGLIVGKSGAKKKQRDPFGGFGF